MILARTPRKSVAGNRQPRSSLVIFTIGHSNRGLDELLRLLRAHDIERLIDVRHYPRSRHNPQFNRQTFGPFLRNRRIAYRHMKDLGGRRRVQPHSPNLGWRNAAFRGFADYMQTPAFEFALDRLVEDARRKRIAIMCAESVPWRCHRSLIADALTVRGIEVRHILGLTSSRLHELPAIARVQGAEVTYPAPVPTPQQATQPARSRRTPRTGLLDIPAPVK